MSDDEERERRSDAWYDSIINDKTNDEDWYEEYDEDTRQDFRYGAYMATIMSAESEQRSQAAFTKLCASLARNDPNVTTVSLLDTKGYTKRLGQALVGNTHVRELELDLYRVDVMGDDEADEGPENLALLLEYLRHGPAFATFEVHGGVYEFITPCIQALADSATLHMLILGSSEIPIDAMVHLLQTTRTLNILSLLMINSPELAQAIGANTTIEVLSLTVSAEFQPAHDGAILRHLVSHTNLSHLMMEQKQDHGGAAACPPAVTQALGTYLASATGLTHLVLACFGFDQHSTPGLIQGLASNASLESLELTKCTFDPQAKDLLRANPIVSSKICKLAGVASLSKLV